MFHEGASDSKKPDKAAPLSLENKQKTTQHQEVSNIL